MGHWDSVFGTRELSFGQFYPIVTRVGGAAQISGDRVVIAGIDLDPWTVVSLTSAGELDPEFGVVHLSNVAGHELRSISAPTIVAAADGSTHVVADLAEFITPVSWRPCTRASRRFCEDHPPTLPG